MEVSQITLVRLYRKIELVFFALYNWEIRELFTNLTPRIPSCEYPLIFPVTHDGIAAETGTIIKHLSGKGLLFILKDTKVYLSCI